MMLPASNQTIYLDHAATTPVDPEVVAAMLPYYSEQFGNPSSMYQLGQDARAALDRARVDLARVLRCQPAEILFTSGATESDNLALSGVAWAAKLAGKHGDRPHLVTTSIEHHAVLHAAVWLSRVGFDLTLVACDANGRVDPEAVQGALRSTTALVTVMLANNETGAIQPVADIGRLCRDRGIPFHVDATQAAGFLNLDVNALNADLLSLSAHKFYGPKGVGLLYVRRNTPIAFQQHGGGQESGRRGGTENVAGAVGMAFALSRADQLRDAYSAHCGAIRDALLEGITSAVPDVLLNGPPPGPDRLPNNANVSLRGIQGETVLLSLDMQDIAASAGSACTTGNSEPSHVLKAMGISDERVRESLRFSVGRSNSIDQVDDVVDTLADIVTRMRSLSSVR